MNVELSERDKNTDKQEGKQSKNTGYSRKCERCLTEEIPEYLERECKRKRNDGEIQM
jgi:hypothetical protein